MPNAVQVPEGALVGFVDQSAADSSETVLLLHEQNADVQLHVEWLEHVRRSVENRLRKRCRESGTHYQVRTRTIGSMELLVIDVDPEVVSHERVINQVSKAIQKRATTPPEVEFSVEEREPDEDGDTTKVIYYRVNNGSVSRGLLELPDVPGPSRIWHDEGACKIEVITKNPLFKVSDDFTDEIEKAIEAAAIPNWDIEHASDDEAADD